MGKSNARIVAPLLVSACAVSLALTLFRECYVPTQVNFLSLSRNSFIYRSDEMGVNRAIDHLGDFSIDGEKIIFSEGRLSKPRIVAGEKFNRYGSRISADSALYLPADGDRPDGWLLEGNVAPPEMLKNPSMTDPVDGRIVVFLPEDTSWLEEDQTFIATRLTPTNLVAGDDWVNFGRLDELQRAIHDPTFSNKVVELIICVHTRAVKLFTDLIPFFVGIPVYMNLRMGIKPINKLLRASAWAFPFVLLQFLCHAAGVFTGVPDFAVCGPLIYVPIAATLYWSLFRKEI